MMRIVGWCLLGAVLSMAVGCGETEECRRLFAMGAEHDRLLTEAKARADLTEKLKERAKQAEVTTHKTFESLGLDMTEEKIVEELKQRAAAIPGAQVAIREIPGEPDESGEKSTRRLIEIAFRERDAAAAWSHFEKLTAAPPLLTISTFIREQGKDVWRLQLEQLQVDRTDVEPRPVPLRTIDGPDTVKSNFGFCGAGGMRTEIEQMRAKIDALRADAERTTVLLPKIATFDGLRHRVQAKDLAEKETRSLMSRLYQAVRSSKTELKAMGYEEPLVVLEVWGGPKERKRLEAALAPLADRLRPQESKPGIIRIAVFNAKADPRRPPPDPEHEHRPWEQRR